MTVAAVFLVYRGHAEARTLFTAVSSIEAARDVAAVLHESAYRDADLGFGDTAVCERFLPTPSRDGHTLACAGSTETCLAHERAGDACGSRLIRRCSVAIERIRLDPTVPRDPVEAPVRLR